MNVYYLKILKTFNMSETTQAFGELFLLAFHQRLQLQSQSQSYQ